MDIYNKIDKQKVEIDKLRPFEGNMLKQIKAYYRIRLTYTSNALEGNTLTENETKVLLEDSLTVGGKPLKYTFEALGHAKAYDFMFSLLNNNSITEQDIFTMHKMFDTDIDSNNAGQYRTLPVIITGSEFPVTKPSEINKKMTDFIKWMGESQIKYHPVEFAALAHKIFVFIHPFIDGNGRLARLIMNTILIQHGYIIAIIPPILRQEYISLLEKAHTDDSAFIQFIAERVYESEKEIVRLLNGNVS